MAEPQQQKERERRRLTKRITTTTTTTTTTIASTSSSASPPTPPDQFSARESSLFDRRTSAHSNDIAYSAVHSPGPSPPRNHHAFAASGAGRFSLAEPNPRLGRPFGSQKLDNISYASHASYTSYASAPNAYQPVATPVPPSNAFGVAAGSGNPRSSAVAFNPPPLPHSKTWDERLLSPKLRASQSFAALGAAVKMERITPPRNEKSDQVSPRQRYSDEARPDGKKKSMFASFLNGVKSGPRRPTISTPSNPMHVTHVGIDNETGKFTVGLPIETISRDELTDDFFFC